MKRIVLSLAVLLILTSFCQAQNRGALTNIYQRWYNVTTELTTITLPLNSRDVFIQNASTNSVCISLVGASISNTSCIADEGVMRLDGDSDMYLQDFITGSVTLRTMTGTASPVSVVVTY